MTVTSRGYDMILQAKAKIERAFLDSEDDPELRVAKYCWQAGAGWRVLDENPNYPIQLKRNAYEAIDDAFRGIVQCGYGVKRDDDQDKPMGFYPQEHARKLVDDFMERYMKKLGEGPPKMPKWNIWPPTEGGDT